MTNDIEEIPIGDIEELQKLLSSFTPKQVHKYNMNFILNKQRATKNKINKRRAKK